MMNNYKFDFLSFGSLNLDNIYCENSPDKVSESIGGTGVLSMCGLAKLGYKCAMVGAVGDDSTGELFVNDLNHYGVDISMVIKKDKANTGRAKIKIDNNGQRSINYQTGVNQLITTQDFDQDYFSQASFLHLTSFLNEKQFILQMKLVDDLSSEIKVSLLLDEHYAKFGLAKLEKYFSRIDYLFVTKEVLSKLTKLDYEVGANKLIRQGCKTVVVIKDHYRSYVVNENSAQFHVDSISFQLTSSLGNKSAFVSGFLHGVKSGKSLLEAAQLGNQATFFCSQQAGSISKLPDNLQLLSRLVRNKSNQKLLVVGGGGREYALAWKLSQEKSVGSIYFAPGNGGTMNYGINVPLAADNVIGLLDFAKEKAIDLTIVGPEVPLAQGIVDKFSDERLLAFGPSQQAAQIESSKIFAKKFMQDFDIPTAKFKEFSDYKLALLYLEKHRLPVVIKADGLAAGKGVFVCFSLEEAKHALHKIMIEKAFLEAGEKIIIEEFLIGEEVSILAFTDGQTIVPMVPTQDHKAAFDGDKGPNTGGMGCYAPAPIITPQLMKKIESKILQKAVSGFKELGILYKGVLYVGLMITKDGPKVLEFNCRFGDPETQVILPLLKSDLVNTLLSCLDNTLSQSDVQWKKKSAVCVVMTAGGYPDKYQKGFEITGLDKLNTDECITMQAGTKANVVTSSGRVLGLTALDQSLKGAIDKAYKMFESVSFNQAHYRTDIGQKGLSNIVRVEVSPKREYQVDFVGSNLLAEIKQLGIDSIKKVMVAKEYKLEADCSREELIKVIDKLLVEKLWQSYSVDYNPPLANDQELIVIAKKPGVMDPEEQSIQTAFSDLGMKDLRAVSINTKYYFTGKPSDSELEKIKKELLINKIVDQEIFTPEKTLIINNPKHKLKKIPLRGMSIEQLMELSNGKLWLDLAEMKKIQQHFKKLKRDPSDVELETIAQTWSEHCSHKTFKAPLVINGKKKKPFYERIKMVTKKINSEQCLSVFVDNAGVIELDDQWAICGKVETHNSPSAIEPYGGAATGSGGVFRDIMGTGQGAKVLLSTNVFCFAPLDTSPDQIPFGCLQPKRLCKEVVRGVGDYGNRMGIPTANGSLHFDLDWRAKPSIIVGAYGLVPKKFAIKGQALSGDVTIVVGGKTGRDGLHGATFSSGLMTEKTKNSASSAVQIGNAIEQKRMFEAILSVRDHGYIRAITDCGAGGFSSAIGEIAEQTGCVVHLDKMPLKYQGLASWEIWISESQERMVLAIPQKFVKKTISIFADNNVEAAQVGQFTDTKELKIYDEGQLVCDLSMNFLHQGCPQRKLVGSYKPKKFSEPKIKVQEKYDDRLNQLLTDWDICSKEQIVRRYDHEVQGSSVLKPFGGKKSDGPNNAVVIEPVLGSGKGMAVAHGMNPVYNKIDPYHGTASAIDEAVRNMVCVGVDPAKIALIDNFIWPTPDDESLGYLDRAVDACYDVALGFNMPFVSGKDSLSSTYQSEKEIIKIPPTVCISAFAPVDMIDMTVSSDLKDVGNLIYIIGQTNKELGASAYFKLFGKLGNSVPKVNINQAKKTFFALHRAMSRKIIESCHDCSEGGLAVAVAEMCFGGEMGMKLSLDQIPCSSSLKRADFILFSESNSRFIVEVKPDHKQQFETLLKLKDIKFGLLGESIKQKQLTISLNKKIVIDSKLGVLKKAWQSTMKRYFK